MVTKFIKSKLKYIYKVVAVAVLAIGFVALSSFGNAQEAYADPVAAEATNYAQNLVGSINSISAPQRVGTMGVTITGSLPNITMQAGFQDQINALNARFMTQFDDFLDTNRTRASSLDYSFETFISGDAFTTGQYVSVVITMRAVGVNTTEVAATTVIDAQTLEVISLSDINPNALRLISSNLVTRAQNQPRLHNSNFVGINSTHPFYLEGNNIVIPFASGVFTVAHRDLRTVNFPMAAFHDVIISHDHIMTLPPEQYNAVLLNLRYAAYRLGYTHQWNSLTQTMNILHGGDLVSSVTVGENLYWYRDLETARALELAPRLYPGTMSRLTVPVSFFRDIMGMATTIIPDGVMISIFNPSLIQASDQDQGIANSSGQTILSE